MSDNSDHDLTARLDHIESTLNRINSKRKKTGVIYLIGIIIIIITLIIFIFNLFSFVKHYDAKAAAVYLQRDLTDVATSAQSKQLLSVMQNKLLPDYQTAVYAKLRESLPLFKSDLENYQNNMALYLENVIKPRLESNLIKQLSSSEESELADIIMNTSYSDRMSNVLAISNEMIMDNVPSIIDDRIDPFISQLSILNGSMRAVYNNVAETGAFDNVSSNTWEIQAKLLENVLQLAIYQINPQEGLSKTK